MRAMDTQMKLLAAARQETALHAAGDRRSRDRDQQVCRRWVLGIIPVTHACGNA